VWKEIEGDLAQPHPMHRLLQGDVGSGKTVIAVLAALRAVENGLQAAVMAPTEILAEQHFRKFSEWLVPLGLEAAWLTGSQTKKSANPRLPPLPRENAGRNRHACAVPGTRAVPLAGPRRGRRAASLRCCASALPYEEKEPNRTSS